MTNAATYREIFNISQLFWLNIKNDDVLHCGHLLKGVLANREAHKVTHYLDVFSLFVEFQLAIGLDD